MQNAIVLSDSRQLGSLLGNLSNSLIEHAAEKINADLGDDIGSYSALEVRAMTMVEALRLTSGFDLTAIMTRGQLIQQIEQESLVSVHPGRYSTLTAMAQEQGISVGELSDTRALYGTIFPYVENVVGLSVAQLWGSIGKSVFREMVPNLMSLITGEQPAHTSVRESVITLIENATNSLVAEGQIEQGELSQEQEEQRMSQIRRRAVNDLLTLGSTSTSRQVRATLRPTRTQPLSAVMMAPFSDEGLLEGEGYAVMKFSGQDQLDMVRRLMGSHLVSTTINTNSEQAVEYTEKFRRLFG